MRVLAVAHGLGERPAHRAIGRGLDGERIGEPVRDRRVVGRGAGVGGLGEALAQGERGGAFMALELAEDGE